MDRKKKLGLFAIIFSAGLLSLGFISTGRKDKGQEEQPQNVYMDVPDGDVQDISESKSDAYMTFSSSSEISDYWDNCEGEIAAADSDDQQSGASTPRQVTSGELFGSEPSSARTQTPASSVNPYRESAQEREARHQKRREEALELADRMQKGPETEAPVEESAVAETITIPSDVVHRSEVISSLEGWDDGSVSSLDETHGAIDTDDMRPFKCMFVREEKIKNSQRVSVRLLEDIVVGGSLVPKNSHIMATCSLNSRLDLEISNIEMQGRILSLGFEAYDTDGIKGIYCPDVGSTGRTIKSRGTSMAGNALSSRVGRLASDVVTTGVSLIESASGERTVTVPAGYTFYIVRKKQN